MAGCISRRNALDYRSMTRSASSKQIRKNLSTTGNPILDALFAQDMENTAGAEGQGDEENMQEVLLQNLVELEKTAAAEGIDLSAMSDDDIAELLAMQTFGEDGSEKIASADVPVTDDQIAAADYLGRVQAHAMIDEYSNMEKIAELQSLTPDDIDELARMHATDILIGLNQLDGNNPEHVAIYEEAEGREKIASILATYDLPPEIEEALEIRTMQHLDANGWDVEKIAAVLTHLANNG